MNSLKIELILSIFLSDFAPPWRSRMTDLAGDFRRAGSPENPKSEVRSWAEST